MKLIVDQRTLRSAVDKAALFTTRNDTLPLRECITISANGKLEFRAGVGQSIRITVPLAAPEFDKNYVLTKNVVTAEDGTATLPVNLFQKAVASMRENCEITLESSDKTHRLQAMIGAQIVAQMKTEAQPLSPAAEMPADARSFTLPAATLSAIARKCAPFCSTDELKPHMMGVLFEYNGFGGHLTATAVDGFTLASLHTRVSEVDGATGFEDPITFIVPADLLVHAAKVMDETVTVRVEGAVPGARSPRIEFQCDGTTVTGDLIDGKFPDWKACIPEAAYALTTSKQGLTGAAARLRLISGGTTPRLTLRMFDGRGDISHTRPLALHAISYDNGNEGTEYIPADFVNTHNADHPGLNWDCNAQLLARLLNALDSDEVHAQFSTMNRAAIVTETDSTGGPEGLELTMLLMPLRQETPRADDLDKSPLAARDINMQPVEEEVAA